MLRLKSRAILSREITSETTASEESFNELFRSSKRSNFVNNDIYSNRERVLTVRRRRNYTRTHARTHAHVPDDDDQYLSNAIERFLSYNKINKTYAWYAV